MHGLSYWEEHREFNVNKVDVGLEERLKVCLLLCFIRGKHHMWCLILFFK